jgi:hypothetical protein
VQSPCAGLAERLQGQLSDVPVQVQSVADPHASLALEVRREPAGATLLVQHLRSGTARTRSLSLPAATGGCSSEALEAIAIAARFELLALLDDPALRPAPLAPAPALTAVTLAPTAPTSVPAEVRTPTTARATPPWRWGFGIGPRVVWALQPPPSFGLGGAIALRRGAWLVGVAGEAEAPRRLNHDGTRFSVYPAVLEGRAGAVLLDGAHIALQLRIAAGASFLGRRTQEAQAGYAATSGALLALPHIAMGFGVEVPFGSAWAVHFDVGTRLLLAEGHFVLEGTGGRNAIASASRVVPFLALEVWHLRRSWNAP